MFLLRDARLASVVNENLLAINTEEKTAMKLAADIVFEAPRLKEEEFKRFRGRHVALVYGKIVSSGNTSKEALEGALQKNPKLKPSDVALYFVPDANELVL